MNNKLLVTASCCSKLDAFLDLAVGLEHREDGQMVEIVVVSLDKGEEFFVKNLDLLLFDFILSSNHLLIHISICDFASADLSYLREHELRNPSAYDQSLSRPFVFWLRCILLPLRHLLVLVGLFGSIGFRLLLKLGKNEVQVIEKADTLVSLQVLQADCFEAEPTIDVVLGCYIVLTNLEELVSIDG